MHALLQALLASSAVLALAQPLAAQSSRGGFSLPQPSPTPTAAPQGPADERSGVQIGPRVIRQTPTPTPTSAPAPTPTPTAAPPPARTASPTPTPRPAQTQPRPSPSASRPAANRPAARTASPSPTPAPAPTPTQSRTNTGPIETTPGAGAAIPLGDSAPGFETIPGPDEPLPEIGPDGWYDVTPDGESGDAPARSNDRVSQPGSFAAVQSAARRNQLMFGILLLVLIGATLATLIWRRKRREAEQLTGDGMTLARGVSRTIANQMSAPLGETVPDDDGAAPVAKSEPAPVKPAASPAASPAPAASHAPAPAPPPPQSAPSPEEATEKAPTAEPSPDTVTAPRAPSTDSDLPQPDFGVAAAPVDPAKLDLSVEIANGTRSVMMFALDFRIDIVNRSDNAVRDLDVAAKLACAQSGAASTAPVEGAQPLAKIERIGPHQSHRITGQLQLPLNQVTAIRQGAKPLFIPLLHVTINGAGQQPILNSFVIGTPSMASQGRVHPLPLDGPPGGLPDLRAQLIKEPR